ncbi:ParA family protein [Anaplasmataceae bacterium AB001_6]|nr:ParA family protein [Anaplasmataceae bacterium AB001_6]
MTISIVNQKGGVGKTTTSINLATAFSVIDRKILLIDLDPQGNSSTGMGVEYSSREHSVYDILINGIDPRSAIQETSVPNLDIITSTVDLSAAEIELANDQDREYILDEILKKIKPKYDFIFLDCPPSLGLLTVNALTTSDLVIIPTQCEFFALEGLSHLLKTINLVKNNLNPKLTLEGIVLTMYDRRNRLTELVEKDIRDYLQNKVYETVVPRNVRLSEAPSHGQPAIIYDTKCSGTKSYLRLAYEILERIANNLDNKEIEYSESNSVKEEDLV